MMLTGLYVYAVVRDDHPCALSGPFAVGGGRRALRRVPAGGLAAVVREAPPDPRARERDRATHQRVLAELLDQGGVLPMRFGVVWPDEDSLRADLAYAADSYHRLLRDLSGRVELDVTVVPDAEQMLRAVAQDEPVAGRLAAPDAASYHGRLELGELVTQALRERQDADADEVLRCLGQHAVRTAVGPPAPGTVLDAGFLVERRDTASFTATADAVGRRLGPRVRLRCSEPLPPYSFVPVLPLAPGD